MINPEAFAAVSPAFDLVYNLYISALRMMIFPLVFCSIVMGIQGIGSVGTTGKVGGQTLLYYCGTTLFASLIGLFLPKLLGLGKGIAITMDETNPYGATQFTSLLDTVKGLIPSNPVASFVNGDIEIIEYPSRYCFAVKFTSRTGIPYNIEDIKAMVEELKPAHLAVEYIFTYRLWQDVLDTLSNWTTVKSYTWEQLLVFEITNNLIISDNGKVYYCPSSKGNALVIWNENKAYARRNE